MDIVILIRDDDDAVEFKIKFQFDDNNFHGVTGKTYLVAEISGIAHKLI